LSLPDLFPGFSQSRVEGHHAGIFMRVGGEGPPLLLLHGFPQTHACWHKVAPLLAKHFKLYIADLRGYGYSEAPPDDALHATYAKRAMALDMLEAMKRAGHDRFMVAGHDRGGRVAYRLALDHPRHVTKIAVLDIVPTYAMWEALTRTNTAMHAYNWFFLAQPAPLPESLIGANPLGYLDHTLASWTKVRSLAPFDPDTLAHYRHFFSDPNHIAAMCADYRAAWFVDSAHDHDDIRHGRKIKCPMLTAWGRAHLSDHHGAHEAWRLLATEVQDHVVDSGHFLAEETPEETATALIRFFG
jgi:haloacetate dehalogenase